MSPRLPAPVKAAGREAKRFILDVLYPEAALCRACGRVTSGGRLCAACRETLLTDGAAFAWVPEELEPGLRAYSLRPHDGIPRRLVISLKHRAEACIADELASLIRPVPDYVSFSPATVVTWVSMPESRRRERCVDHGRLLAEAAARELGLACRQLLLRADTRGRTQVSLSARARKKNLSRVFEPAEEIAFPVLLVDDVLTTGTTARRCTEALRRGGAEDITVLTVTRSRHPGSLT